jgi:hypothetical protein
MTHWQSLFLWSEQPQPIIEAVQQYLEAQVYLLYKPFARLPGMAYPITLKMFVSPIQNDCVRVLIEGDELDDLAAYLSQKNDCLAVSLDGRMAFLHFFRNGELCDLARGLADYAKADSHSLLAAVLQAEGHNLPAINQGKIGDVPLDMLPDDLQAMAKQVNAKQANQLFQKIAQKFIAAVGQYDAQTLLQNQADWDSPGGQYIRAVMACLQIPENWREPDFATLRTAYAVQSRQQYDSHMPLLPGDEQSLQAVPNALDYVPVYGGKKSR